MEGEVVEIRNIVGVDAVAEFVIGRDVETLDEHAGHGAESDIDHVIARTGDRCA
jgi:hypothetical protein